MRRRAWQVALLFSSLGVVAQSNEPSSTPSPAASSAPSSQDPQGQEQPSACHWDTPTETSGHPASASGKSGGDESKVVHQKVTGPGLLLYKVAPKYPKAARKKHIQGTVLLCAEITKDGTIANLRAASGPEALIPSAVEAVRQWRYRPYMLDGKAVAVETEIRVNFRLE